MGTFRIAYIFDGENRYPEQVGIIGLGYCGQRISLVAMGTRNIFEGLGLLFARSGSEEKDHGCNF
jgi:hypothetical protein